MSTITTLYTGNVYFQKQHIHLKMHTFWGLNKNTNSVTICGLRFHSVALPTCVKPTAGDITVRQIEESTILQENKMVFIFSSHISVHCFHKINHSSKYKPPPPPPRDAPFAISVLWVFCHDPCFLNKIITLLLSSGMWVPVCHPGCQFARPKDGYCLVSRWRACRDEEGAISSASSCREWTTATYRDIMTEATFGLI